MKYGIEIIYISHFQDTCGECQAKAAALYRLVNLLLFWNKPKELGDQMNTPQMARTSHQNKQNLIGTKTYVNTDLRDTTE